jgi:pyridoxal phosphate-dependent aminotransferase EpsN
MSGYEEPFVREAFQSNWIAPLGPMVDAFEREMCAYIGIEHALALVSGTGALHLAFLLCADLTFSASANAITYAGARPVFIDCDRETWCLSPRLLEEELEACAERKKPPAAVLAVDLYGQCADYEKIEAVCERHGVPLIEDSAEALGATYQGRKAGSFGKIGIFSFNGNKVITTSGGGMLVSRNAELVKKAKYLATQARDPAPHYEHSEIGYNYRMSNILAAIGRGQLMVIDERIAARTKIYHLYQETMKGLPGISFIPETAYGRPNHWLTCILIDPRAFGATREDIRLALEAENIESRPVWKPMHLQPVFASCRRRGGEIAADLFDRGLCLPSGSSLTEEELFRVADIIKKTGRY